MKVNITIVVNQQYRWWYIKHYIFILLNYFQAEVIHITVLSVFIFIACVTCISSHHCLSGHKWCVTFSVNKIGCLFILLSWTIVIWLFIYSAHMNYCYLHVNRRQQDTEYRGVVDRHWAAPVWEHSCGKWIWRHRFSRKLSFLCCMILFLCFHKFKMIIFKKTSW